MPADAQFAVGSVVFVPDEQQAYLPKRVASCTGLGARTKLTVGPLSGSGGAAVPAKDVADVVEADPLALEGAQDMVKFSNLTEAALLHNLRTRYSRDQIYSAAGAILLSVNPFKQIPGIYTDEVTRRCQEADARQSDKEAVRDRNTGIARDVQPGDIAILFRNDNTADVAKADESVRVIVLAGAGKHFSAGHDLGSPQDEVLVHLQDTAKIGRASCRESV